MSPDAIEFLIIVVGAILIVSVIFEVTRMVLRHNEVKHERFLEETRSQRLCREEVENKDR